jgi:hypothetical protein
MPPAELEDSFGAPLRDARFRALDEKAKAAKAEKEAAKAAHKAKREEEKKK